jgi:hypothetical protein
MSLLLLLLLLAVRAADKPQSHPHVQQLLCG